MMSSMTNLGLSYKVSAQVLNALGAVDDVVFPITLHVSVSNMEIVSMQYLC